MASRKRATPVTLLHLMDRLMERQLDAPAADLLKTLVERKGITVMLNASTARIVGASARRRRRTRRRDIDRRRRGGVRRRHPARIPRSPRTPAFRSTAASLSTIALQTSAPDIFALGECAEHRGVCYGLVEPAYEQARALAGHLAGRGAAYKGSVVATNLKVSGVSVFSAGDFIGAEGSEEVLLSDVKRGTYKKLVISDGRLTGAVLIGDTSDALWYLEMIRARKTIAAIRKDMMFGRALAMPAKAA